MVRAAGSRAGDALLRRVRRGEVGGVIVFPEGASAASVKRMVRSLRAAARDGGAPPLLVAIDQEGGEVKRLPGPPFLSQPQLGSRGDLALAEREGRRTGRYLRRLGIDVDFAPVVDVPSSRSSFISSRAYGASPTLVGGLGAAFARGLERAGVAATAKHFPGLGRAPANTDDEQAAIGASRAQLRSDIAPIRALIGAGVQLVMVATATYSAFDDRPAAWSRRLIDLELRKRLGFRNVVVTDDLASPGVRSQIAPQQAATTSTADIVLFARRGSDRFARAAYDAMLAAARDGSLSRRTLEASYRRIRRLKQSLSEQGSG
jgi:beta-N-acetylhexosaminidase